MTDKERDGLCRFYRALRHKSQYNSSIAGEVGNIEKWFLETDFTDIKVLSMVDQHLTIIPKQIAHFVNLEWLNVSDNLLTDLPDLSMLKHLKHLDIVENPFENIDAILEKSNHVAKVYYSLNKQ